MSIRANRWIFAAVSGVLVSINTHAAEDDTEPTVAFSGFIRGEYGVGDRYPEARGEDRLGISKAALAADVRYEGIQGVFVIGTERLTDGNPDNDGNVDIKDAFIVIGGQKERGFSASIGAQALLFGLKPNGYPGDRSLQPSIEFGGAGAFAVSNQAGPSLIGTYKFSPAVSVRFGAFDLDSDNGTGLFPPTDGSSLGDNLFVLVRANDLLMPGLYAAAGLESIYVGGAVNDSKSIATVGVGFKQGLIDASVELMQLDAEIVGATDDERYVVAELALLPNDQWTVYFDWADASESEANTLRVGAHYQLMRHLILSAEYSKDEFDVTGATDVDSADVRLAVVF